MLIEFDCMPSAGRSLRRGRPAFRQPSPALPAKPAKRWHSREFKSHLRSPDDYGAL